MPKHISGWIPGRNVCFTFDDKTAEPRTDAQLNGFITAVRAAANSFDFDIVSYGTEDSYAKMFRECFGIKGF